MAVTFKSQATGNLVMVSAHAEALLKLLGKTATEPGILEGRSAGMWTVALRFSGNFLGLDFAAYQIAGIGSLCCSFGAHE